MRERDFLRQQLFTFPIITLRSAFAVCAVFTLTYTSALSAPPGLKTLPIGQQAPDFELPGTDDKTHRLSDFSDAEVLVVVFTCNHCPTAQAYEDRLIQLHQDYHERGVALVAISPNDPEAVRLDELGYSDLGDSLDDMKKRAADKEFPFPYLYDGDSQKTSFEYGAVATPHVFVFDRQRKLRYTGRVDDGEVKPPKSHDTRNAIEAILAGKSVPVEKTRVFGCSTKWKDKRDAGEKTLKKWEAEEVAINELDVPAAQALLAAGDGKYRLINFWATWCAPCVTELPELVDVNRMYRRRNFELVTISLDDVEKSKRALRVLNEMHASTKNFIFAGDDKDALAEAIDPEWEGALPHTVLVDPKGNVVHRNVGPLEAGKVRKAIVERLGRTYAKD